MLTKRTATALVMCALAAIFSPANAQPLPSHVLDGIEAGLRNLAGPAPVARAANSPKDENAPLAPNAAPAVLRIGGMSADASSGVSAPAVAIGWNYSTATSCFGVVVSWGAVVYLMNMSNGYYVASTDPGAASYFAAACSVAAQVAIRVVSISGTNFNWDAGGFAR